ncbi:MAG: hypothetical protein U0X20_17910 [Caldilineaceae bacterium]
MYNAPPSQLDVRDARISELTSLADFMQEDVPLDAIRDYVFERLMQLWPAAYVQYCKRYNQLVRLRGRDATPGPRLDYLQWLPLVATERGCVSHRCSRNRLRSASVSCAVFFFLPTKSR